MAVRIGVIGVGLIGQDHIRRLTTVLLGPTVVAVSDSDAARARAVAAGLATEHRPLAPPPSRPGDSRPPTPGGGGEGGGEGEDRTAARRGTARRGWPGQARS